MQLLRRSSYFLASWLFCVVAVLVLCALGRTALWIFAAGIDFGTPRALDAWMIGIRFDLMVAAYLSTPVLLCLAGATAFPRKRKIFLRAAWAVTALLCILLIWTEVVNFGFFCEYRDQFNVWVLGVVNDDANAIFRTITEDYHWEHYLTVAVFLAVFWICVQRFLLSRVLHFIAARNRSVKFCMASLIAVLVLAPICYRGGVARRPPRLRDAAVCENDTVNKLVLNPVFALKHVVLDMWEISNGGKAPDFVNDIRKQAALLYGERAEKAESIDSLIMVKNERTSSSSRSPKRVYLFLMESYDRWPMVAKYDGNDLCATLRKLEKAGASSENFASGASGTMLSLTALMSGIPHVDVAQNYRPGGAKMLPTATAKIFKDLGYKTRFAYCGYGFWQHVEDYAKDQGFDEIVLGSDVADCPDKYKGEWGVPDGFLFSHLEKLADEDGDVPVFTLILSASNHPPYNLPLDELGCAPATFAPSLKKLCDGTVSMNTFSHFKYADQVLGEFVDHISKTDPEALFAVTGDHFSRRFLNKNPSLSERTQVPFVVVGPGVPVGKKLPFGTHADIIPTLLSLCAPDGFEYPTFGVNLFSEKAERRECTIGSGLILHKDGGTLCGNPKVGYGAPPSGETAKRREALVDAWRALAWYYFEKGSR